MEVKKFSIAKTGRFSNATVH